jgi:hypothetical protein
MLTVWAEVEAVSAAAAEAWAHNDGVVLRGWHVFHLRPAHSKQRARDVQQGHCVHNIGLEM